MGAYKTELAAIEDQKQLLAQREADLKKTNDEITVLEQSIQTLTTETQALQTKKVDIDNKVAETDSNQKAQQTALEAAKADLDKAKMLIKDIAGIEAIQKEMIQIRTQIEESEIELTQLEGAVAAAQVERDRLEKVAAELVALRADQEAGVIRGEFQSTIKKAYNQWGFVVVAGGFDQGVVNRAQLDVYRRGQPICRLLVTSVEASESAADIVAGSLAPGQSVQPGDTVVKSVKVQTPAVVPASAPGGGAAAGAAPAAGGAAAGGAAPAAPDPFGGMAPAAPAAPDPFGAPPAGGAAPAPGTPPIPLAAWPRLRHPAPLPRPARRRIRSVLPPRLPVARLPLRHPAPPRDRHAPRSLWCSSRPGSRWRGSRSGTWRRSGDRHASRSLWCSRPGTRWRGARARARTGSSPGTGPVNLRPGLSNVT